MSATENEVLRSWVEVDLDALRHNADVARRESGTEIMAIVKAGAYGHGVARVAQALVPQVAMFGVANLREAIELRDAGIDTSICLLGACLEEEYESALQGRFHLTVNSLDQAHALNQLAGKIGIHAQVHAVVDTGMGRLGFPETEWQEGTIRELIHLPHLTWEGFASHLPVADEDNEFTHRQITRFREMVQLTQTHGMRPHWTHLCNSAGILGFREPQSFCNLTRPGLLLYGVSPLPPSQSLLRSTLTWKTRITLLRQLPAGHGVSYGRSVLLQRPSQVATLACGYADGYPRQASNQDTHVLIHGKRCPLLGRVTMDQIMVDVTDLPENAHVGDEVVLLGQQGDEMITPVELADKAGTIAWDIFTGIGRRVTRLYCEV
ncbi:alanine racemase [Phragmitibacter flavus]|nr:alanine racemase [Phragmitibacter flavus]